MMFQQQVTIKLGEQTTFQQLAEWQLTRDAANLAGQYGAHNPPPPEKSGLICELPDWDSRQSANQKFQAIRSSDYHAEENPVF